MVKIGEPVPDLEADAFHNEQIRKVKLSQYRGKWLVLVFYPADFTFVCPTELEGIANRYEKFKECDAEVLCISTDTVFVHKAWHDTSPSVKKIGFPMLSDTAARFARAFGTYSEEHGISLRGSFVIDPDGVLRAFEIHDTSIGRNAKELLRKLEAAKYVREHDGEVCPESWEPGSKTIKPGLDLVGKI